MDKKDEILGTVLIGILLARFLLNTSRVLQAIKLFQECLILLNNLAQGGVAQLFYTGLYFQMIEAYYLLNDHTSGIECAKKLLEIVRHLSLRNKECIVTSHLANIYELQNKYEESKYLFMKSLSIAIEAGDKKREATCYGNLGTIYQSLGEYGKAEEYQRKALAIGKNGGQRSRRGVLCKPGNCVSKPR